MMEFLYHRDNSIDINEGSANMHLTPGTVEFLYNLIRERKLAMKPKCRWKIMFEASLAKYAIGVDPELTTFFRNLDGFSWSCENFDDMERFLNILFGMTSPGYGNQIPVLPNLRMKLSELDNILWEAESNDLVSIPVSRLYRSCSLPFTNRPVAMAANGCYIHITKEPVEGGRY